MKLQTPSYTASLTRRPYYKWAQSGGISYHLLFSLKLGEVFSFEIQLWGQEYGINIEKAQKLPKINLKIQVAKLCFKLADKSGDGFVDVKEAKQLYRHIMDRDMPR